MSPQATLDRMVATVQQLHRGPGVVTFEVLRQLPLFRDLRSEQIATLKGFPAPIENGGTAWARRDVLSWIRHRGEGIGQ